MVQLVKLISVSVQDHEKTKTSICTFLSVLAHFNIILPKVKDEVIFFPPNSNNFLPVFSL